MSYPVIIPTTQVVVDYSGLDTAWIEKYMQISVIWIYELNMWSIVLPWDDDKASYECVTDAEHQFVFEKGLNAVNL